MGDWPRSATVNSPPASPNFMGPAVVFQTLGFWLIVKSNFAVEPSAILGEQVVFKGLQAVHVCAEACRTAAKALNVVKIVRGIIVEIAR